MFLEELGIDESGLQVFRNVELGQLSEELRLHRLQEKFTAILREDSSEPKPFPSIS